MAHGAIPRRPCLQKLCAATCALYGARTPHSLPHYTESYCSADHEQPASPGSAGVGACHVPCALAHRCAKACAPTPPCASSTRCARVTPVDVNFVGTPLRAVAVQLRRQVALCAPAEHSSARQASGCPSDRKLHTDAFSLFAQGPYPCQHAIGPDRNRPNNLHSHTCSMFPASRQGSSTRATPSPTDVNLAAASHARWPLKIPTSALAELPVSAQLQPSTGCLTSVHVLVCGQDTHIKQSSWESMVWAQRTSCSASSASRVGS